MTDRPAHRHGHGHDLRHRHVRCHRHGRRAGVAALALLALLAPPDTAAADTPDPAIGRMNYAGYRSTRHCTMFAVSPRTVVTAAHCLSGIEAGEVHLLFGYAAMGWTAHLKPVSGEEVGRDVAVLCIDEDAPAHLAVGRDPGAATRVVGYGIPVVHRQAAVSCPVLEGDEDEVLIGCGLSPGASGAPVLNAAGEAVAVVSRSGQTRALATLLPADIAGRCR